MLAPLTLLPSVSLGQVHVYEINDWGNPGFNIDADTYNGSTAPFEFDFLLPQVDKLVFVDIEMSSPHARNVRLGIRGPVNELGERDDFFNVIANSASVSNTFGFDGGTTPGSYRVFENVGASTSLPWIHSNGSWNNNVLASGDYKRSSGNWASPEASDTGILGDADEYWGAGEWTLELYNIGASHSSLSDVPDWTINSVTIGYEGAAIDTGGTITPEPSSALLVLLSSMTLLRRRR